MSLTEYQTKQQLREAELQILYLRERIVGLQIAIEKLNQEKLTVNRVIQEECDENGVYNKLLNIVRLEPTTEGLVIIVR